MSIKEAGQNLLVPCLTGYLREKIGAKRRQEPCGAHPPTLQHAFSPPQKGPTRGPPRTALEGSNDPKAQNHAEGTTALHFEWVAWPSRYSHSFRSIWPIAASSSDGHQQSDAGCTSQSQLILDTTRTRKRTTPIPPDSFAL